jgi:hypothetical protein
MPYLIHLFLLHASAVPSRVYPVVDRRVNAQGLLTVEPHLYAEVAGEAERELEVADYDVALEGRPREARRRGTHRAEE